MKLSYRWLQSFLPGLTLTPPAVAEVLTLHSFETVVAHHLKIDPLVRTVRIETIEPHPGADRLRLVAVTDGTQQTRVVCGAPNIAVGDIVPFSPPGTTLYDQTGTTFVLQEVKIRGENSPGMLNSLRELGLGASHAGIFVLPTDTPVGVPLATCIPDDVIFEADITRNRAHDCLSHRGVARELSAVLDLPYKKTEAVVAAAPLQDWSFATTDPRHVIRYMGIHMTDVKVQPSPLWLQARLLAVGIRPINNVVDITNYVMVETGQPLHAFDVNKLPGKTMGVRFARDGEQLGLLDGIEYTLNEKVLVITNGDTPVAVAGIMGGAGSAVDDASTTIFLELATFLPFTIQQAAASLGLRTEASNRFIKGINPERIDEASALCIHLMQELAGAHVEGVLDHFPHPAPVSTIAFDPTAVSMVAGTEIGSDEARTILERLRCQVDVSSSVWQVTPPADRMDITGPHDVIEEVIRVRGLHTIPLNEPAAESGALPPAIAWREALRAQLIEWGFAETYNYSFEVPVFARALEVSDVPHLQLVNPISPELSQLRINLLPGLLQHASKNKGEFFHQRLFEIGTVFRPGDGGVVQGVQEQLHIAGIIVGEPQAEIAVATIRTLLEKMLGVEIAGTDAKHQEWLGALPPAVLKKAKLTPPVAAFEFNLTQLLSRATQPATYIPLPQRSVQYVAPSKYPPVWRDIALRLPPGTSLDRVEEVLTRAGGELLVAVDLFDVYQDSVAFRLKYQAMDRTLTADEVAKAHAGVAAVVMDELNATIRE